MIVRYKHAWPVAIYVAALTPIGVAAADLPIQAFRICPTLENARNQADASRRFGAEEFDIRRMNASIIDPCKFGMVAIPDNYRLSPESSIGDYITWSVTYDPKSGLKAKTHVRGRIVVFNFSYRKQINRWYRISFQFSDGSFSSGWVEVPSLPYMVAWLRDHPEP